MKRQQEPFQRLWMKTGAQAGQASKDRNLGPGIDIRKKNIGKRKKMKREGYEFQWQFSSETFKNYTVKSVGSKIF